jgi:hypothetical protein
MGQSTKTGGMALSETHFATPALRGSLFEGFLRDIARLDESRREMALKQALETAFLAGATLVRANPSFDPLGEAVKQGGGVIGLDDLPHDAQDGLALMSQVVGLGYPGSHPNSEPDALVLQPFYTADGKRSWWAELPKDATEARWAPWVILTLERFGLIAGFPGNPGRLTLTHRAIALMQRGEASLEVPATPAWERNPKARELAVNELRQPAVL